MAKRKTSRQTRKSRRKTNWSLGKIFSIGLITLAIVLGIYYTAQYYEAQSANKAQTASIDVQKYFDVTLPVNRQEQLIEYTGFFVSFNKQYHILQLFRRGRMILRAIRCLQLLLPLVRRRCNWGCGIVC